MMSGSAKHTQLSDKRVTRQSAHDLTMTDDKSDSPKLNASASIEDKIDYLCRRTDQITFMMEEIKQLRSLNNEKDKKIAELESRIDDIEQYSRVDNVIISGFQPKYSSYSRVVSYDQDVARHDVAAEEEQTSLEDQVVSFLQQKDIPIDKSQISACHTLPSSVKTSPKPIVVRFVSRKAKIDVLRNAKKLNNVEPGKEPKQKKLNVYINEHLTTKNSEIAKKARDLRRQKRIINTWTRNCKVFVKIKVNDDEKVMMIKNINELDNI